MMRLPVFVITIILALLTSELGEVLAYYKQNLTEGERISNGQYLMVPDIQSPTLVPSHLPMQEDCNLVLYNQSGWATWSTGTFDQGLAGACYATVEKCVLVIYSGVGDGSTLWNSSNDEINSRVGVSPCFATIELDKSDAPSMVLYDAVKHQVWNSTIS